MDTQKTHRRPLSLDINPNQSELIQACLTGQPFAWQKFVDANLPLVVAVISKVVDSTEIEMSDSHQEFVARDLFQKLREKNFEMLRKLQDRVRLETALTILARRMVFAEQTKPAE